MVGWVDGLKTKFERQRSNGRMTTEMMKEKVLCYPWREMSTNKSQDPGERQKVLPRWSDVCGDQTGLKAQTENERIN